VTGIWFSGGGRFADTNAMPRAIVHAAPGRIADLARGIARRGGGISRPLASDDTLARVLDAADPRNAGSAQVHMVVTDTIEREDGPAALHARWLAPALECLGRKRLARLTLIADGHGVAARWTATTPTFWQRVSVRAQRKPFAVPALPES
jgi:hypothetical protein